MKKHFRFLLVSSLLAVFGMSLMLPNLVTAQTTTLEQRLQQYKKDRSIDDKKQGQNQNVKLRCGIAQASMKNLLARIITAQENRKTAYKNISDILDNLLKKLNEQAFETTTLKTVTDTYNAKVATYTTDIETYRQAVEDVIAVDCVKDTGGFIAALETARIYHDRLNPDITDIRSYTTVTVKTTLDQIKKEIAKGNTTGGVQQ